MASVDKFYDLYKDAGLVPIEILTKRIIAFICFCGIALNSALVHVTIKSKSLHSSCNILIALYAFASSFLMIGHCVTFLIVLFGINYIKLQHCFYMQLIPILGASFAVPLQLCIGIDRLVGVSFPIWYKIHSKQTLFKVLVALCCGKCAFVFFYVCYGSFLHWEKPVMCTASDPAYQPETVKISNTGTFSTYCGEFICYAMIWLIICCRNAHGLSVFDSVNNKRLMVSLSVIMSIGLVCYIGNLAFYYIIMPVLSLDIFTLQYIVTPICNALFLVASGSSAPVLFMISKQYRKAFLKCFSLTQQQGITSVVAVVPQNYQQTNVVLISNV